MNLIVINITELKPGIDSSAKRNYSCDYQVYHFYKCILTLLEFLALYLKFIGIDYYF